MTRGRFRVFGTAAVVGIAGAALVACTPPHAHVWSHAAFREISSLDCPASFESLQLKDKSADGAACDYAAANGDVVNLKLVKVTAAGAPAILAPIEAQLKADIPAAATKTPSGSGADDGWGGADHDKANIDLPGLHIHSSGNGHAVVDVGGMHINAVGDSGSGNDAAHVVVSGAGSSGVIVDADNGSAVVRVAGSGPGLRDAYILASDHPGPQGWRLAAYEARGPRQGPIVIATLQAKRDHADDLRHTVGDLLKANVGG